MAFLRNPVVYVPDLTNGRPIVDGKVYVLVAGTIPPMHDSAIDAGTLVTVSYENEAGNIVTAPQPLYTSKGGCLYGNYPDSARQYMISPQEYVFAVYNRLGQYEYSGETFADDYVYSDELAASNSTVPVGGVDAGALGKGVQVTAQQYGAVGNGATNDTAAFTALEAAKPFYTVNLQGKTYLVDKQFTGCDYVNGAFKVGVKTFPVNRKNTQGDALSSATLLMKWSDARYTVPDGLYRAITILGDSISHGAYQLNLYQDGWVNIFKRMMNAQTGCRGYGFANLLSLGSGGTLSKEIHDVSFGGTWTAYSSTLNNGGYIPQGLAFKNTASTDTITITVPTFQRYIRVWYIQESGGGTFGYAVNGGAVTNVVTAGATDLAKSVLVDMTDNRLGACQLVLSVISGTVTICGVGYETPLSATNTAGNVVQNFSNSGRRFAYATEEMIDTVCKSSTLIFALGHNDQADVQTNSTYRADFIQRVDWLIQYCQKYNTSLIVADFCWSQSLKDNICRQQLRRAAIETRGQYIPLPDYLYRDQMLLGEYGAGYYQVDTLEYWTDTSHPNVAGAKWIAETIAADMGLSVRSKREALEHYDWPFPMQFISGTFENNDTVMPYLSYVQRVGGSYQFNLRVRKVGGGTVAAGDYQVNKDFTTANVRQFQVLAAANWSQPQMVTLTNTNSIGFAVQNTLTGRVDIRSVTPYLGALSYSFSMPADFTANRS